MYSNIWMSVNQEYHVAKQAATTSKTKTMLSKILIIKELEIID